jgi:IclR family acetate operon transcriptional repressor
MTPAGRSYSIAVVGRTLDLLEALAAADEPMGTTEFARQLGMTKSAVFRILATLEERAYVTKDPVTARYSLGPRLASLGERALAGIDLRHVARPAMERLHAAFGETVNLGVLDGNDIIYLDMVESTHGLRMSARVGSRHPAHSTALGKAMLAFLPEEHLEARLSRPLTAQTSHTVTNPAALREQLRAARARGVAEEVSENEEGARCLGVALFDLRGHPTAALSVSAPETRINDDRAAAIARALREASRTITQTMGGTWPAIMEDQ